MIGLHVYNCAVLYREAAIGINVAMLKITLCFCSV